MTTIIVSPIARLTASRTPPTTPGKRRGQQDLADRLRPVAPSARLPSRIACGTAAMKSSAIELTNGMIMMPMTRPAASALSLLAEVMPSDRPKSRTIGATVSAAK